MKFNYNVNHKISRGAWCAVVEKGKAVINVEIGLAVEHTSDFFVQGVWDGEFSDGDFMSAHFSCCTGANVNKSKQGCVIFSTPNHLLETLYSVQIGSLLYISNSSAFVLERSGSALDVNYPDYQLDMCSSIFGVKKQIKSSPLLGGRRINYYRCCNFEIDSSLNISVSFKDSGLSFTNYADYYLKIQDVIKGLYDNAESKSRKIRYSSISTISRGYDAVATSVLAHQQGCDKVITFNYPEKYIGDCGEDIAKCIGFSNIYLCDADKYRDQNDFIEAECMSSGDVGSSIIFASHKDLFKNSMVMMGIRGDSLWERNHVNVNDDQDFTAGNTLQQTDHIFVESCLDVNAVCIPLPMIGADRWADIARISQSDEMKKYSLRESYDRPIPRRIAEDYGVPRDWFGLEKAGAGISYHFDSFNRIIRKMSETSAKSLQKFKKNHKHSAYSIIKQSLKFYGSEMPVYLNYLSSKLHIGINFSKRTSYVSSPLSSLLINWSINTMRIKYKSE